MKDALPVQDPLPGIYLSCVDSKECRDSLYVNGSHNPRPVIYGAPSVPPGFVFHDKDQCPVPRTSTFQTLEEFYAQDFLQTFTDCLKSSDFSTRGAKAMGFSSTEFFEGSTVNVSGQRVKASLLGATLEYPYECCMQPSFYIANVRGLQRNTAYYNPLFTTVHDFNCFAEDGCHAGGTVKNIHNYQGSQVESSPPFDFPKASPRSVMWYMQHAIATVNLDDSGIPTDFWEGGMVGKLNAIGGATGGGIQGAQQNLGGNAALFSSIKNSYGTTDTPSQAAQVSYGVFSCPTTDGSSIPPYNTWTVAPPPINFKANYMYPTPGSWADWENILDVECCTRGTQYTNPAFTGQGVEGGVGIIPERLLDFLVNAEAQSLAPNKVPSQGNATTCSNYHCFESPYCQSLLAKVCKNFDLYVNKIYGGYGGHCTRWRNWASNNYAPIQPSRRSYPGNSNVIPTPPNFNPSGNSYPNGAYPSSVDQSVFTLIDACSSTDFSQPQPQEILDQCNGLLSSNSIQTQFPRLRPITFDTPIVYSTTPVTPFTVDSTNNHIDILLTFTQYKYIIAPQACPNAYDSTVWTLLNFLLGGGDGQSYNFLQYQNSFGFPFLIIPQIENFISVTSITLDNIVALTTETFYEKVRNNFNQKINKQLGFYNSLLPSNSFSANIPTGPFINNNYAGDGPSLAGKRGMNALGQSYDNCTTWPNTIASAQVIYPAFINHSTDFISWTEFSLTVYHTLTNATDYLVPLPLSDGSRSSADYTKYSSRLANLTYLYNPTNIIWNSVFDFSNETPLDDIPGYPGGTSAGFNPGSIDFNATCSWDAGGGQGAGSAIGNCWQFLGTRNASKGYVIDQNNNFVQASSNLSRIDDILTVVFNSKLSGFLGLDGQGGSISVNLNPMRGANPIFPSITSNGTPQSIQATAGNLITFSSPFPVQSPSNPINIFNLTNTSQFWLTNTTPIPIYSLSVLNYSGGKSTVTFLPPSNPASPLLPGASVSVNIFDPSDPDNTGSFTGTPILFYDGGQGGWQNNFNSPDFPVLGGLLSARGIDISSLNSYGAGERFSSFSSDTSYELGEDFQGTISTILTYYKNQNIYSTGEANSGGAAAISQMFLSPLI